MLNESQNTKRFFEILFVLGSYQTSSVKNETTPLGARYEFPTVAPIKEPTCFICKRKNVELRLPRSASLDLFVQKKFFVDEKSVRCCLRHLTDGFLDDEAISKIVPTEEAFYMTGK